MSYIQPDLFEQMVSRVVPVPRQVQRIPGTALKLSTATKIEFSAPAAEFGPVKTAGERMRKLLSDHCGENYAEARENSVRVHLSIVPPPFEMRCADEGYRIRVTEKSVEIEGFGENGLLYGVITFGQMCIRTPDGCQLPALEIIDWPDNPLRGLNQESRWGSDMMTREEWMLMLEDLAARKMNTLKITIYGCWGEQYDDRISQYVYFPVKGRPELRTPKTVKYWSARQGRWVHEEKLPPIYEQELMGDICCRARDLGIQVIPTWNSYGHNNLLPTLYPETAPIEENGERGKERFCTSAQATYDLLFEIYDQILACILPYGMKSVHVGLDEIIVSPPEKLWCYCPECRSLSKGELFIRHVVRLVRYLKQKGAEQVLICSDMLQPRRQRRQTGMEYLLENLMEALKAEGLEKTLLVVWWDYHDHPDKTLVDSMRPETGVRGFVAPWNGYYQWSMTINSLPNSKNLALINQRDGGEGLVAYGVWDRGADRVHDAIVEYAWNLEGAGEPVDVTRRYAVRHFGPRAHEAFRAFRMMDWCTEERYTSVWSVPEADHISNMDLMMYRMTPYFCCGKKDGKKRVFVDEELAFLLTMRNDVERSLYSISAMAREAEAIFGRLAQDSRCDRVVAERQAYECAVYHTLAEDWLAILEMHDLSQKDERAAIVAIARNRQQARLDLLAWCERVKERCVMESMAMRQHSIFVQLFADIADYVEDDTKPQLNLLDAYDTLSDTAKWLR